MSSALMNLPPRGIVIPRLQIEKFGFGIVVVTSVPERILGADPGCPRPADGQRSADVQRPGNVGPFGAADAA